MSHPETEDFMTEAKLDEVSALLESDLTPDDCMDISMLQGYLTAVLLGPEMTEPEVWLKTIWGEGPEASYFAAKAEASRLVELVVELYNEIAQQLQVSAEDYEPILYLDEETGLQIARPWCMGFMYGAALNEEAWQPLLDDAEYGPALLPVVMCADEEERSQMDTEGEDPKVFEDEVAEELPEIVAAIYEYWQTARKQAAPARAKGRNR